ncbi:MAG: hypothetical protein P0Y55_03440 [Candidatus Cohnella colombiensis]|uniref:Uncharacterized protein n=1 Tax=Candidatus Cohnella colombiensis TaxID=3121368 RepID=A0AA95JDN0_9BACL|nr:MAG: hypothetical protein P0Y55_03440 [Cohnella sp.]
MYIPRRRSKWLAGLLAFIFPGTGHMYLGLMLKAIMIMLLIAFDISAIVYIGMNVVDGNELSIVLLSFVLAIIYFYNLFDAIQSTEMINDRYANRMMHQATDEPSRPTVEQRLPNVQFRTILLVAAGIGAFIVLNVKWKSWLEDSVLSIVGAVLFIVAGIGIWFWETRQGHNPK